jgi:restriction endonuclease S subunit
MENNFRRLGDICNVNKTLVPLNIPVNCNDPLINNYPVINAGKNQSSFHHEYNTNEHTILCASIGSNAGFINKYNMKIHAKNCFTIIPIDDTLINNLYLYHILKFYQEKIYNLKIGVVVESIEEESLNNIIIPVPSLEVQLEIVNKINNIDIFIKQMEDIIKNQKEQVNNILSNLVDII